MIIDVELPGAYVRFTGRAGGVSPEPYASLNLGPFVGDDAANVTENLRRASGGLPTAAVHQVHGIEVREALAPEPPQDDADGLVTAQSGLVLVVTTADCLPVALAGGGAVAMLHAGWRGLSGGILEAGLAMLQRQSTGGAVHAAIGPGAGACCYEVGPEVAAQFPRAMRDGGHLDLKAAASERLRAAGVSTVADVRRCTMCEPDVYFSPPS